MGDFFTTAWSTLTGNVFGIIAGALGLIFVVWKGGPKFLQAMSGFLLKKIRPYIKEIDEAITVIGEITADGNLTSDEIKSAYEECKDVIELKGKLEELADKKN